MDVAIDFKKDLNLNGEAPQIFLFILGYLSRIGSVKSVIRHYLG